MKTPPVRYASGPEGKIAYQVVGDGPLDLVLVPDWRMNPDVLWEHPPLERYLRRLASFSRLILINFRGGGLSDPLPLGVGPLPEELMMDLRWVLDAAGSERAAILSMANAAPAWFAATFPDRTLALAIVDGWASLLRHDDYPWGFPAEALNKFFDAMVAAWGTGQNLQVMAPELAVDERVVEWFGRLERLSASPTTVDAARRSMAKHDLRGVLSFVRAPTLVIAHKDSWIRPGHGRYLADHIPNARYVERPGFFGLWWAHDVDWTLDEVQAFFTGTRGTPDLDDRVLATVLFTDIVSSTERAAEIGDKRWRALLDEHDAMCRREIDRFRGRSVKSTGDGILATFDGPARAIRCALSLRESLRALGIEVYSGLHTGEIEVRGEDVGGIAVNIAARVMAEAGAGDVLVSGAVPPLVAGSDIQFDDRGVRTLKGVPGAWRLFAVTG